MNLEEIKTKMTTCRKTKSPRVLEPMSESVFDDSKTRPEFSPPVDYHEHQDKVNKARAEGVRDGRRRSVGALSKVLEATATVLEATSVLIQIANET